MGIQNCRRCGGLFLSSGSTICQDCIRKEEEQFEVVKEYLFSHSGASVRTVTEDTGVPVEIVMDFVRQGRIVGTEFDDEAGSRCYICKRPVASGKICPECQKALAGFSFGEPGRGDRTDHELPEISLQKESPRTREQMYTIDTIRRRRK
jgi:hypothetical protein